MDVESLGSQLSSLSKVEFIDIRDQYSYNEDLTCRYSSGSYVPGEGDRVALYKSGWMFVKDYFLFEWVPTHENHVTFNYLSLPRDFQEFFQFCYISADNEVLGASKPFQFNKTAGTAMSASPNNIIFSLTHTAEPVQFERELRKLREENETLKETLKVLMGRKQARNYDREVNELKGMIYELKDVVNKQSGEINVLKSQVKACNRSLIQEKTEMENKFTELQDGRFEVKSFQEFELGELESIPPFPFAK